jgi:uncharacterized protein
LSYNEHQQKEKSKEQTMQYRDFGNTGFKVSALGFGAMRLPTLNNDSNQIDEAEAIRMIRYAIDQGVNYVDTAWPYHGGNSELVVGKALLDGYREKVVLATKLPIYLVEKTEDFDHFLNKQLEKLQTDHVGIYMVHALNRARWEKAKSLGILDWLQKPKEDGRVGYIGFSFHDAYPAFEEILNDYDGWDFCQIQYNYMDIHEQAGQRGLHLAAEKGLAVIVMEPLMGGSLANVPDAVEAVFRKADPNRSPVDWALQWLWDQSEVSLLLSGMSTMEQVEENLESAANSGISSMSAAEKEVVTRARDLYKSLMPIHCTGCEYCLPCPSGVYIPRILALYNRGVAFDNFGSPRFRYGQMPDEMKADQCIECGACEEACPQGLDIIEWLKVCQAVLGEENAAYDPSKHPAH